MKILGSKGVKNVLKVIENPSACSHLATCLSEDLINSAFGFLGLNEVTSVDPGCVCIFCSKLLQFLWLKVVGYLDEASNFVNAVLSTSWVEHYTQLRLSTRQNCINFLQDVLLLWRAV